MSTKLYAAYGSNLNLYQMSVRCLNAKTCGIGFIDDYKLTFRSGGYANIEPSAGDRVPVLVWEINAGHEANLDRYEGYPDFYKKMDLPVDMDGETKTAMVYVMNDNMRGRYTYPTELYLDGVRQGYEENGLPTEYLIAALNECKRSLGRK